MGFWFWVPGLRLRLLALGFWGSRLLGLIGVLKLSRGLKTKLESPKTENVNSKLLTV